jgi:exosortase F-associated protein
MSKWLKIILLIACAGGLVLIRQFASDIFYDPLIAFFKTDHTTHSLPDMNKGKLFFHITLRYFMNSLISLVILWIVFRNRNIIRLSGILFTGLFLVFLSAFVILIYTSEAGNHMALFYVRRFLIQPLFLLLLLPAFYFHKRS